MNLSTGDRLVLRCMADSNVLQNASHLVKSPLKDLGTSLGNLTLLLLSPVFTGGTISVGSLSVSAVVAPSGSLLGLSRDGGVL